ncbi:hypothetical protein TNCV_3428671 [Trichonephila clavipes]|nr:hypothetical protein TNCV_3428671 [Trichonephila clavipes]
MFGGIERSSNKCFFDVVQDRSKDILLQSIKSNIKKGTTVYQIVGKLTIAWNMKFSFVFQSITVCISKIQKRALTRTQIEGSWSSNKKSLHGTHRCKDQFESYLAKYMWRKMKRPSNPNDLFTASKKAVKEIYHPLEGLS